MVERLLTVSENEPIADNIFRLSLVSEEQIPELSCGKFVNISVGASDLLLKRPFGLCDYDRVNGKSISVCYQLVGKGTSWLSERRVGEKLSVTLPLGNGFSFAFADKLIKKVALIGGGVGVFPLYSVCGDHSERQFFSYLGFRNSGAVCLEKEFESVSNLRIATDDGSRGFHGNSVSMFLRDFENLSPDLILACGPAVMLRALKNELIKKDCSVPVYVSTEERMGCGVGACLACACKMFFPDGLEKNVRVCRDGPVFDIWEIEL